MYSRSLSPRATKIASCVGLLFSHLCLTRASHVSATCHAPLQGSRSQNLSLSVTDPCQLQELTGYAGSSKTSSSYYSPISSRTSNVPTSSTYSSASGSGVPLSEASGIHRYLRRRRRDITVDAADSSGKSRESTLIRIDEAELLRLVTPFDMEDDQTAERLVRFLATSEIQFKKSLQTSCRLRPRANWTMESGAKDCEPSGLSGTCVPSIIMRSFRSVGPE